MNPVKYAHLLLAVDFSPETEPVVARAAQLQGECGARLSLLHVVEYLPMAYSGDLILPDDFDLEQQLLDVAKKQMQALGNRLQVSESDRHIGIGSIGPTILRTAEEIGADLIIIGSHGHRGLAVLLGSTARNVLNSAPCDVLAVRINPPGFRHSATLRPE